MKKHFDLDGKITHERHNEQVSTLTVESLAAHLIVQLNSITGVLIFCIPWQWRRIL